MRDTDHDSKIVASLYKVFPKSISPGPYARAASDKSERNASNRICWDGSKLYPEIESPHHTEYPDSLRSGSDVLSAFRVKHFAKAASIRRL